MKINDFDGDNLSEILVSSPWGLGVIGFSSNSLTSQALAPNGSRLGGWLLNTADNEFGHTGDFDGDGRAEILATSGWGLGVLKLSGAAIVSPVMAPNGTRLGGWLLNTANDSFGPVGDFDGDGRSEILITSGWGIGLLKQSGSTFASPMMAANGTRFGDWLLNAPDNRFGPVGDFDGDGKAELLACSLWGIGILELDGGSFRSIAMVPNGTDLGGWVLDVMTQHFGPIGDFDGDGKVEIVVSGPAGLAILKLSGTSLTVLATVPGQTPCGGWVLTTSDKIGPIRDFDGDGKAEIFVSNATGIGLLKLVGGRLQSLTVAANGTRLGDWLVNTRDNRFLNAADFDGDNKAELLVTSPWGLAILDFDGSRLLPRVMAPNQTVFGNWRLNTADNDWEHGQRQSHLLIIHHPQWSGAVANLESQGRRRGYTVHSIPSGPDGLKRLRLLAMNLSAGDRLLIYLAGHGGSSRAMGDMSRPPSLRHIFQFGDGGLTYLRDLAPYFESLGDRGADVTVFDGSCDGGETVHNAMGEAYVAMATAGVYSPGLTNFPDMAGPMQTESKPGTFGYWWDPPHWLGSWLNGTVIGNNPGRIHQRIYRNDSGALADLSIFARPMLAMLSYIGAWNLMCGYNYLYEYIFPAEFGALPQVDKDKYTNDTQSFLTGMHATIDPQQPILTQYKKQLTDAGQLDRAAQVYAANAVAAWQTLVGDQHWQPFDEPVKYNEKLFNSLPSNYRGTEGFKRLAAEAMNSIEMMETCQRREEALLWKIDAAVKSAWRIGQIAQKELKLRPVRPVTITTYQEYNLVTQRESHRLVTMLKKVNFSRDDLTVPLERPTANQLEFRSGAMTREIDSATLRLRPEFEKLYRSPASVKTLVAELQSVFATHAWHVCRATFQLSIVEDAINAVQSSHQANRADVVPY